MGAAIRPFTRGPTFVTKAWHAVISGLATTSVSHLLHTFTDGSSSQFTPFPCEEEGPTKKEQKFPPSDYRAILCSWSSWILE